MATNTRTQALLDIIGKLGKHDHEPLTYLWKKEHEFYKLAGGSNSERWTLLAKEHGKEQFKDGKELCKTFRATVKKYNLLKEAGTDEEKNEWPFWAALAYLLEP